MKIYTHEYLTHRYSYAQKFSEFGSYATLLDLLE